MASFTRLHVPLFDSKHSGLVAARQGARPTFQQHNQTGKFTDVEYQNLKQEMERNGYKTNLKAKAKTKAKN
jgi:hypothetical protein